jgi:uncharacterized iron-regulated membrane protein
MTTSDIRVLLLIGSLLAILMLISGLLEWRERRRRR